MQAKKRLMIDVRNNGSGDGFVITDTSKRSFTILEFSLGLNLWHYMRPIVESNWITSAIPQNLSVNKAYHELGIIEEDKIRRWGNLKKMALQSMI